MFMNRIPSDAFRLEPYFAKVACEKTWRWRTAENTPLDDFDLWYVWGGEGEIALNGMPHAARKGSCFLFVPGDLVIGSHNPNKPLTVTYIHFSLTSQPIAVPSSNRVVSDIILFEVLLTRYMDIMLTKVYLAVEEAQLILKQLMLQLLREDAIGQQNQGGNNELAYRSIFETANYIRVNPSIAHTIDDLAWRSRLSKRYFSSKFKELLGETVEAFIIRCRIERAEHLLRFSDMNVTEVAETLGYQNIYFFSKQYKLKRGVTPSSIKRNAKS